MTGMKEGAGEDPFADDNSESDNKTQSPSPDPESDPAMEGGSKPDTVPENEQSHNIPYKFRRDSVQDDRDRVPLFLQSETKTAEREAMRQLEDRFEESVSMTDLREALVKVGLEHVDKTAELMEEWGYGLTFE